MSGPISDIHALGWTGIGWTPPEEDPAKIRDWAEGGGTELIGSAAPPVYAMQGAPCIRYRCTCGSAIRHARVTTGEHALGNDDAAELLSMLGLVTDEHLKSDYQKEQ